MKASNVAGNEIFIVIDSPDEKQKCEAAMAVEALDPGAPTKVGGHHVTGSTDPARDSSREDR